MSEIEKIKNQFNSKLENTTDLENMVQPIFLGLKMDGNYSFIFLILTYCLKQILRKRKFKLI